MMSNNTNIFKRNRDDPDERENIGLNYRKKGIKQIMETGNNRPRTKYV